jgi:hypothetical protein
VNKRDKTKAENRNCTESLRLTARTETIEGVDYTFEYLYDSFGRLYQTTYPDG